MGLASVVQNPMNCDMGAVKVSVRVRASRPPPPSTCFSSYPSLTRFSVAAYHYPRPYPHRVPILCSKPTGQAHDDGLSASGSEGKRKISAQPHDDVSNIDTSSTHSTQQSQQHETYISSVRAVSLWVCTAVAFGLGLGFKDGVGKASEFFAGYILEQSLSVDNLFVFVLIFKYFKVPIMYQNRVLSYGIAGAVFFRLTLILLGTATLQRFEAVNLLLAAILLYSSFKLFASEEDESDLSNNFVVNTCQKFIPVTTYYDGNRFITNQDGVWKGSNILGRPHLYFLL